MDKIMLSLTCLVASVVSILFGGWVLTIVWGWFILPVFTTAPVLTIGAAIGLKFMFSYFTMPMLWAISSKLIELAPNKGNEGLMLAGCSLLLELILLSFGWILSLFIL